MKNKKKWIISGIIAGILAVTAVVVIVIIRKPAAVEIPVPGVKLGMDSKELKKILDKKGIEYNESERLEREAFVILPSISVRNLCIELFEHEVNMADFWLDEKKNKLVRITFKIFYSTKEEREEDSEKVKAYYTKKYGKPEIVDAGLGWYSWTQGNESIDLIATESILDIYYHMAGFDRSTIEKD